MDSKFRSQLRSWENFTLNSYLNSLDDDEEEIEVEDESWRDELHALEEEEAVFFSNRRKGRI